jgi:hypothetical protein
VIAMKEISLGDLPEGAIVRGTLYNDPAHDYELGDVLQVELKNGFVLDVGYRQCNGNLAFVVAVCFPPNGRREIEYNVYKPEHVPEGLRQLAEKLSQGELVLD